jgi:membrane protease YdiL (CAAX protease family)
VDFPWDAKGLSRIYFVGALYYLLGSVVPLALVFLLGIAAIKLFPEWAVEFLLDKKAEPTAAFMLIGVMSSFIGGFGAQIYYLRKQLRKADRTFNSVVHFDLSSVEGKVSEVWRRSLAALSVGLILQTVVTSLPHVPYPHQATAEMAAGLHGGGFLVFAGLAALLAPIFEEIIFRGFLFNSLRRIFREGLGVRLTGGSTRVADYLAVAVSALVFAAAHMDLTSFAPLFILGIILAELYRRSGTLACPILLHALNNVVATMLILGR